LEIFGLFDQIKHQLENKVKTGPTISVQNIANSSSISKSGNLTANTNTNANNNSNLNNNNNNNNNQSSHSNQLALEISPSDFSAKLSLSAKRYDVGIVLVMETERIGLMEALQLTDEDFQVDGKPQDTHVFRKIDKLPTAPFLLFTPNNTRSGKIN